MMNMEPARLRHAFMISTSLLSTAFRNYCNVCRNHKDTETQRHRGARDQRRYLWRASVPLCLCVFVVSNVVTVFAKTCTRLGGVAALSRQCCEATFERRRLGDFSRGTI